MCGKYELHSQSSPEERNGKFGQNGKFGRSYVILTKGKPYDSCVSSSTQMVGALSIAVMLWQQFQYYYY